MVYSPKSICLSAINMLVDSNVPEKLFSDSSNYQRQLHKGVRGIHTPDYYLNIQRDQIFFQTSTISGKLIYFARASYE